jgi:hypothetical protein
MWRAMLFLLCMSEVVFARQLESFKENPAIECPVEFDSSLEGAGGLLYRRINWSETCIGVFAVDLKPFEFEDVSSYQNTAEYIGVILGLIAMVKLGFHGVDVQIREDCISALTWAETGRPRGELVTNASIVFTLLCVATGLTVRKATHLEAKDNWRCDTLSRTLKPVKEVMIDIGRSEYDVIDLSSDKAAMGLFAKCNPGLLIDGKETFSEFWKSVRQYLVVLSSRDL